MQSISRPAKQSHKQHSFLFLWVHSGGGSGNGGFGSSDNAILGGGYPPANGFPSRGGYGSNQGYGPSSFPSYGRRRTFYPPPPPPPSGDVLDDLDKVYARLEGKQNSVVQNISLCLCLCLSLSLSLSVSVFLSVCLSLSACSKYVTE